MFSLRGKLEGINPNRFNKAIAAGLDNDAYIIYYSYDSDKETITYEAILKSTENTSLPLYLKTNISSSGEASNDSSFDLYAYVLNHDKEMSETDEVGFEELYAPIKDKIGDVVSLDTSTLKARNEARNKFSLLVDSLIDADSPLVDGGGMVSLYPIILFIPNSTKGILSLQIGVGANRYQIKSIGEFIKNVKAEKIVSYSPEFTFKHVLDAFTLKARELIKILPLLIDNNLREEIKSDAIVLLLENLKGQTIVFGELNNPNKDVNIYVDKEEKKATISLDKDGNINIEPDPEGLIFYGQEKSVYIDMYQRKAYILNFDSGLIQKIYSFASDNPLFNYQQVKDIVSSKLFPLVDGKVEIDEDYKKAHSNDDFKIQLLIDLLDDDALGFKTNFFIKDKQVTKSDALNNFARNKKYQTYESILNSFQIPTNGRIKNQSVIGAFLSSDLINLRKVCDIQTSKYLQNRPLRTLKPIKVKVSLDNGWLDLGMDTEDYTREEIREILEAYKEKRSFARLKDKIVFFSDEQMSNIEKFKMEVGIEGDMKLSRKVPFYEIFNLSSYSQSFALEMTQDIVDIITEIKNFKESNFEPKNDMNATLRSYQIDGFKWLSVLYKYSLGGILADDMGLGKTLQLITLFDTLSIDVPLLVVSPKSVLYNWENEIHTFAPKLQCKVIVGTKKEREKLINGIKDDKKMVYLVSYDTVRNDVDLFKKHSFGVIALDEAQYIKNSMALKTKAVKELDGNVRFVLTGTPIENSLTDIWSIFDFLMPGYLFSEKEFIEDYELEIVENANENVRKKLQAKIAPFILRRTKTEVLHDLPPKVERPLFVTFDDNQKKIYDTYLLNARNTLSKTGKIEILAALTRLREICVDPSMFISTFMDMPVKFEVAKNNICTVINEGHKVLVFSSFRQSLEHLKYILEGEGIVTKEIYGSTEAKDRLEIAKEFNKESSPVKVLLVSLKAGGTGLNLIGADTVIHLDPWWNLAAENQASDRAHRIGQKHSVTVIKMVVKGTIEEKVLMLQEKKKELVDMVIREGENAISSLSDEDIKFLLS